MPRRQSGRTRSVSEPMQTAGLPSVGSRACPNVTSSNLFSDSAQLAAIETWRWMDDRILWWISTSRVKFLDCCIAQAVDQGFGEELGAVVIQAFRLVADGQFGKVGLVKFQEPCRSGETVLSVVESPEFSDQAEHHFIFTLLCPHGAVLLGKAAQVDLFA